MAVCPNGHDSASDDFCDVCGMRIVGAAPSPATGPPSGGPAGGGPAGGGPAPWPDPAASAGGAEPCPRCGTPRTGQFCEACGYNFSDPRFSPGPPPTSYSPPAPGPGTTSYSQPAPGPAAPSYSQPAPGPGTTSYSPPAPGPAAPSYSPPNSGPAAPSYSPPNSGPTSYSSAQPPPAASPAPPAESGPASPPMASFPYPQATWTAVVAADRAYYDRVQAVTGPEGAAVAFPGYCAERRFQLTGNQMQIGRRSVSRGLAPEIDLTGPPADPGISRLHAVLIAMPDGNWAVLDPGSANGTLVNGSEIGIGDQVPLHDGDRINLGAWTAITVHRGLGNSPPGVGHRRTTTDQARH